MAWQNFIFSWLNFYLLEKKIKSSWLNFIAIGKTFTF
jgi:hypothetical protein